MALLLEINNIWNAAHSLVVELFVVCWVIQNISAQIERGRTAAIEIEGRLGSQNASQMCHFWNGSANGIARRTPVVGYQKHAFVACQGDGTARMFGGAERLAAHTPVGNPTILHQQRTGRQHDPAFLLVTFFNLLIVSTM